MHMELEWFHYITKWSAEQDGGQEKERRTTMEEYTFRAMRRKRQQLSREDCEAVLRRGTHGVLALTGDGGWPYAVPLSYVYDGTRIYFHSAKAGHKIDAVRGEPRASFCVVDEDRVVPEKYTAYFRSVICFGTVRILESDEEKRAALEALGRKYAPRDTAEGLDAAIRRDWPGAAALAMDITHMTGKEAIELVRARKQK